MSKPGIPKGTRDFSPVEVAKRQYIFDTIRSVFKKYGYQPIETPTMEMLSTLTGKYGDEGDQLIFKVLNSGDYLLKADAEKLAQRKSKALTSEISEKALRYDLTVPFARYVVMNQHNITLPFKRYQIQPVWRADRPQKGRYREFYQCDADVVGSESLLNEAEFVLIYDEALSELGLKDFSIKINNRKILAGIAEIAGKPDSLIDMTVAIDKLDKIGLDGVRKELIEKGFSENDLNKIEPVILLEGNNSDQIQALKEVLKKSETGMKGIEELEQVFSYFNQSFKLKKAKLEIDITLARGLNYYTGAIFEVKTNEAAMGSIGGGGRYDDLTGMFGLKNLTGVGISFGADRIYDVMEELNLFPKNLNSSLKVFIIHYDEETFNYALPILQKLRDSGIASEIYHKYGVKENKQYDYALSKNAEYLITINKEVISSGMIDLKNIKTKEKFNLNISDLVQKIK